MKSVFYYDTAVGRVGLAEEKGAVTDLFFGGGPPEWPHMVEETDLLKTAAEQLSAYFSGARTGFDLPLAPAGTPFQQTVWEALRQIPYGETRTYGQIAKAVGKPKASRAVGGANNRNPIAIIIPCHRVIGANGSLTGYAGGLGIKEKLLRIEREISGRKKQGFSAP